MQDIEIHNDLLRSRSGTPFFNGDSPDVTSIPFRTPTETGDRLPNTIAVSSRKVLLSSRTIGRTPDKISDNGDNDSSGSESNTSDNEAHLGQFTQISPAAAKSSERLSVFEVVDDSEEEINEVVQVKNLRKKVPARLTREPAGRKRLRDKSPEKVIDAAAAESQDDISQGRNLRKRTLIQERPYQADRVRHQKSQKSGGVVGDAEVEEEIKATQRKTKSTKTAVKAKSKPQELPERLSSVSTAASSSASRAAATPDPSETNEKDDQQILMNTTLWVQLDGGDDSAVPILLSECLSLTSLFEAIEETWGSDSGRKVKQIQAILPWKAENKIILMRQGWDSVWRIMINQILRAPVWAKSKKGEGVLEVKLVARLG